MVMSLPDLKSGDQLPELVSEEITRTTLALFCGGSGDHNPIHIDTDFARRFGMPDVFAHGMLSMAYLGQLLTRSIPQARLRSWGVRFLALTPVHATVRCTGRVVETFEVDGERRAKLAIDAYTDGGAHTLSGEATFALA